MILLFYTNILNFEIELLATVLIFLPKLIKILIIFFTFLN